MSAHVFEEFVYLPHVDEDRAIVAWGGFFIKPHPDSAGSLSGRGKVVSDEALPPLSTGVKRDGSIGRGSTPYGRARIRFGKKGQPLETRDVPDGQNHLVITDLAPDTEYVYAVEVQDGSGIFQTWAAQPRDMRVHKGEVWYSEPHPVAKPRVFRTFPPRAQSTPKFSFAVIGDPGTGKPAQFEIGAMLAAAIDTFSIRFILTTGDNIYRKEKGALDKAFQSLTGRFRSSGDQDDDWFDSYFLPYRDVITRVPVFPTIGNHDMDESEEDDDLVQLVDNFYLEERFPEMVKAWQLGGAVLDAVFYRFQYGRDAVFLALDTCFSEKARFKWAHEIGEWKFKRRPPLLFKEHQDFLAEYLDPKKSWPRWLVPFGHHPPFSVGPNHKDVPLIKDLWAKFDHVHNSMGLWFAGHEHNFQHNEIDSNKHIFLTGAAGKGEKGSPNGPIDLTHCCHSGVVHFLIVEIDGDRATVHPISADGAPVRRTNLATGEQRHEHEPITAVAKGL